MNIYISSSKLFIVIVPCEIIIFLFEFLGSRQTAITVTLSKKMKIEL